jgi:hypothetical protein
MTTRAKVFRELVIPVERPTVPIADNTSNSTSIRYKLVFAELIRNVAHKASIRFTEVTAAALLSALSSKRRPKTLSLFVFARLDHNEINITANVVVLIPRQ